MSKKTLPNVGFYNGRECDIISRNGGWTEILDHDGKRRKVRNGEVKLEGPTDGGWGEKPASKVDPGKVDADELGWPSERVRETPATLDIKPAPLESAATPADKKRPEPNGLRTPTGRKSADVGDRAAQELRGLDLDGAYAHVCSVLGVSEAATRVKYMMLNAGQQRMNLGNRLRAHYRKLEADV